MLRIRAQRQETFAMTRLSGLKNSSLLFVIMLTCGMTASAQTPVGPEWWPSRWGPDDERGAANLVTPERVLAAAALIRRGDIYELGRGYEPGMPLFGNRHFSLTIPGLPTVNIGGDNAVVYNDELVSGELGQIGTQFDGLGHVGTGIDGDFVFYNGFKLSEFGTAYGLDKLGIENVGTIFTRGVLIDVPRLKGVTRLEPSYIITVEDIEDALALQDIEIREGDAVLFHTGWGQLWMVDNDAYSANEPGQGITAIRWLADRNILMTGADNYAMEASPGEDPNRPIEGHQWLLNRGIYNIENLDLSQLAADRVYEFAFIFSPMKLVGATGAPGNPIAVR
jgi:kynurenine formamidase